jgi:hypothetical protein
MPLMVIKRSYNLYKPKKISSFEIHTGRQTFPVCFDNIAGALAEPELGRIPLVSLPLVTNLLQSDAMKLNQMKLI